MRIDILTIFPKMFDHVFSESLIGKAQEKKRVSIHAHNIRTHAHDKHRTVDDRPYGGGPGMVMKPEPIFQALRQLGVPVKKKKNSGPWVIHLSPQGKPLTQKKVNRLADKKHLILICGHYEGIDERLFNWIDEEISVGDAVYTGGEIPAMALTDAVARKIPGVVKEKDSLKWDSFAEGWSGRLDCPHYTRPAVWRNKKVPDVLLKGHHKDIQTWRAAQSYRHTKKKRPDLL